MNDEWAIHRSSFIVHRFTGLRMPSKYRVAVVGTGRVGALWESDPPTGISHAGAFFVQPDCELVAGANRRRDRLEEFGRRFGVRGLYSDYNEMLRRERPDIVC